MSGFVDGGVDGLGWLEKEAVEEEGSVGDCDGDDFVVVEEFGFCAVDVEGDWECEGDCSLIFGVRDSPIESTLELTGNH